MDSKIACVLGAAAALTAASGVVSVTSTQARELPPATAYRDLLDPIPDALAALKSQDAQLSTPSPTAQIQDAQWWRYRYRREHHHHHHHYRREHHHHHHHHHSYYRA